MGLRHVCTEFKQLYSRRRTRRLSIIVFKVAW